MKTTKKEKYVVAFKKQNNQPGKYAVDVVVTATGLMDAVKKIAKKPTKEKEIGKEQEYVVGLKKDNNRLNEFALEITVIATGFTNAAKRIIKLIK